ncbi:ferredoxin family protein [Chloroflexota bacterium]
MPPIIDEDTCTGCGTCVDICPEDVFWGSVEGQTPVVCYPNECWNCNSCVLECEVKAISLRIPLPLSIMYK